MRTRKRVKPQTEKHDRWLVSYADLVTLLFAFFVVMYSISSVNEDKYKLLLYSLEKSFSSSSKPESSHQTTETPATSQLAANNTLSVLDTESFFKAQIAEQITQILSPYINSQQIEVTHYPHRIEVEMKSQLLFESAQATLTAPAFPVLKQLARLVRTLPNKIHVEGYTDNRPIHTTVFPSNWELSAARAASVVHELMRHGIAPQRMAAIGYGEYHPITNNDSAEERLKNRRVVLALLF